MNHENGKIQNYNGEIQNYLLLFFIYTGKRIKGEQMSIQLKVAPVGGHGLSKPDNPT